MVRWNKKICIEHLTQMRSPLEEGQPNIPEDPLQALIEAAQTSVPPQGQPQRPINVRENVNQGT